MSIKPLIFLFFAWLVWGGFVAQNVLSQNAQNQRELQRSKLQSQGQVLEWFFQERTLQLKSLQDDEPVVSRYSQEQWKNIEPWKALIFLKSQDIRLYGSFDKMMPEAHKKQLTSIVRKLAPAGRIEGVYWEAFQWNGSPFILAFVTRNYGTEAFLASASDWGRSLALISDDSGWYIANQAGTIVFHSDSRYVGEKIKNQNLQELAKSLVTTNLVGRLTAPSVASTRGLVVQLIMITLGMALISSVLLNQLLKKERVQNEKDMRVFQDKLYLQQKEFEQQLAKTPPPPPPVSDELKLKDLSHRVASSLGRQMQPSLINILGQAQWLASVSEGRHDEEKVSIETIVREARQSKSTLDKLLAVAGENELHKFPMKLETPVLRTLKRWEHELQHNQIEVEKNISDTSFFPLNSEAIEKALGQMIQNSVEAMVRKLDKKLKIEILDEGDTLLLVVEDNGSGIESHHLTLISDPFFTTKNHQNRLGLGLTEAFGILKQHHAIVQVSSEVGVGTRFEIRFDKNEAQRIMSRPAPAASEEIPDDFIVIPQNLPRPLEEPPQEDLPAQVSAVVDEEIEKLLEITDLEFIESPDQNIVKKKMTDEESTTQTEDFMDENPMRGQDA